MGPSSHTSTATFISERLIRGLGSQQKKRPYDLCTSLYTLISDLQRSRKHVDTIFTIRHFTFRKKLFIYYNIKR